MPQALPLEVRRRLKRLLQVEVVPRFAQHGEQWQTAAADEIGVSQSTISRLMQEPPAGGSLVFGEKLAKYLNHRLELVLHGIADDDEAPRLRDLPSYEAALAAARRKITDESRDIEPWALQKAADYRGRPAFTEVTAELLISIAVVEMRKKKNAARKAAESVEETDE